jgi:hypothetical protein
MKGKMERPSSVTETLVLALAIIGAYTVYLWLIHKILDVYEFHQAMLDLVENTKKVLTPPEPELPIKELDEQLISEGN